MDLGDKRIDQLTSLIKDSFRVRPNQDPVYVDVSGNLQRVRSEQHQIVFGRRGSGKSCLLVHFHRTVARQDRTLSIYIDADEIKRLGYPDALIRLLLKITEAVPGKRRGRISRRLGFQPTPLQAQEEELRRLLDLAEQSDVTAAQRKTKEKRREASLTQGPATGGVGSTSTEGEDKTSVYKEQKLDALERHFSDFKGVLQDAFAETDHSSAAVIVDDFYLIDRAIQPDVLDYLHRLLRGTDLYLKLGTVRHRTTLQRTNGQPIGVDPSEDVEQLTLDRTFEDVDSTREFLELMLDSMAHNVGIETAADFISPDGRLALALASGGVPRDYLNILVEAISASRNLHQQRVTPRTVYRGAARLSYRSKLKNLRDDVGEDATKIERVFADLATFCLKEERKTGFLVSQEEVRTHPAEHEVIQQLMDFKLIHVIEPDTSAASGRTGRYEAYTLDFSLFMEPRLRGIRHIEFWRLDDQRRRAGVREAPTYSLERARTVAESQGTEPTESIIERLERDIGTDDASASSAGEPEREDTLF